MSINIKNAPAPTGIKARRGTSRVSEAQLRQIKPTGNTVLRDFGRVLRDEPHKYIYPIKLYMVKDKIASEPVLEWLRSRYINAKGGRNHGARYEVRTFKSVNGKRYVDYVLLERMTDDERVMFTMEFGEVTDEKVVRDGKLRRPRLSKTEKSALDDMINNYYLEVERRRKAEREANLAAAGE